MLQSRQSWFEHPHSLPRTVRHWLCDTGSLTQRLKTRCDTFRVVPLTTQLMRPNQDEYGLLGFKPGAYAYVRNVLLLCNEVPVVFAHSVLPHSSLRGAWNGISRLGSRPLGQALFSDHRIQRQTLAYRNIHPDHPLFRTLTRHYAVTDKTLRARRSVFALNAQPLLVTEVFLPEINTL